ncbi:MAG: diaminopimelate decarboxylase [Clostridia bacterium]|nr:diaminopimelate decarboxylase [Clostridia bacterium]
MSDYICGNISAEGGKLFFGGHDTTHLAEKYGTPLYVYDEQRIRHNCRIYRHAMSEYLPRGSFPLYAGKAACFRALYRIMSEENMGVDVVSSGEIYTAFSAGFDMRNAFFHGNCKTDEDIAYAMECGVGYFVVDNRDELFAVNREAERKNIKQKILLRLTPGVDPHTYSAVNTGCVDSKFGNAIETGQASEITRDALALDFVTLCGFHCHVGSQVFGEDVFERAAEIMLRFIAETETKIGYHAEILNLGGGFGVRYIESDPDIDIDNKIKTLGIHISLCSKKLGIIAPRIILEPGRSIVADAGMTLYTVGSVKKIPGYKNYVAIDGGMTDNPRFALYGSRYTCLEAGMTGREHDMKCDLVGRCCESGDIIAKDIYLSSSVKRGDLIAVFTTGAYNYSMASNYNRLLIPAVVMINGQKDYIAVKRQTYADLAGNDM